jgi:hypothetical protein
VEEYVLKKVRAFIASAGARDICQALFEQWRLRFRHLSTGSRLRWERTVYSFVSTGAARSIAASCRTLRPSRACGLTRYR